MSWFGIGVKPRGGPPEYLWLECQWRKIDSVGAPEKTTSGDYYGIFFSGMSHYLLKKDGFWYVQGGNPNDDRIFP